MKKEKKKGVEGMRKFLSILMVLMLVFTFLPRIPISFGATSTASVLNVIITPAIVGEVPRIDIVFDLDVPVSANSDNLVVTFPIDAGGDINKEFILPSSIPTTAVLIDGSNNISDVQVDLMNRKIAVITSINLFGSGTSVDHHTLTFLPSAGIKNPKTSGYYSLKFHTSQETADTTSPVFFIYPTVFDHLEISPDPAFVESNKFPSTDYIAGFGNHVILRAYPKDIYDNTLYEGFINPFGTYVTNGDSDCGIRISANDAAHFRYCDSNANGHYDCYDCLYLDSDNSFTISVGDIRITASSCGGSYTPGSAVKESDVDIGNPLYAPYIFPNPSYVRGDADLTTGLTAFLATERHAENINSNGNYDYGEWIYNEAGGTVANQVDAGDVRLTSVTIGGITYAAGTTVAAGDLDEGTVLVNFLTDELHDESVTVDGAYTAGENIYKDLDGSGSVTVGDQRLTIVTSGAYTYIYNSFVREDEDVGDTLTAFPANELYYDANGDTIYSPGEWVYRDVDTSGTVTAGDIRLSTVIIGSSSYLAGSVCQVGELDVDKGYTLTPFAGNEMFVDSDSSGTYTPGERIYRDLNGNGVVSYSAPADLRLSTPSLRFYDSNLNGAFDSCDLLYLDMDNSHHVSNCDIRMTAVNVWTHDGRFAHYMAGTKVSAGDLDATVYPSLELKDIAILEPDNMFYPFKYRFYDYNLNGVWDSDEPLAYYIDFADNNILDSGDFRISSPFNWSWSVPLGGGVIDNNGFYTSPTWVDSTPPQTFTASASLTIKAITRNNTSTVVVFDGPPKVIVSPQVLWIAPCTDFKYSATVVDANNNPIPMAEENVDFFAGYPRNTIVDSSPDAGISLINFAFNEKHTENVEINGTYDAGEWVYRDMDNNGAVSVGDIRLTLVKIGTITYAAGSIVGSMCPTCDVDLGKTLVAFNSNEMHAENVSATLPATYDPGEWIYRDNDSSTTATFGDRRLTDVVDSNGNVFPANSFVGDTDGGTALVAITNVKFVDLNGNGYFDPGEWLYQDVNNDGEVDASGPDVRLFSCMCGLSKGNVVAGDGDIGLKLIPFVPVHSENVNADGIFNGTGATTGEFNDLNGNCTWDPGEEITPDPNGNDAVDIKEYAYLDVDASGTVSIGDIRVDSVIIPVRNAGGTVVSIVNYDAGSVVEGGDLDIGWALASFTGTEKYVDSNNNGQYDAGEYIYDDTGAGNTGYVGVGDKRLIKYESICPDTTVATGDPDVTTPPMKLSAFVAVVKQDASGNLYLDVDNDGLVSFGDIRLSEFIDSTVDIDSEGNFHSAACGGGTARIWASFTYNDGCPGNTCVGNNIVYNENPVFAQVTMGIKVWVTPESISLISGERKEFSARTEDALYHTVITPPPVWSIVNNDPMYPIGTIDPDTGLFTAQSDTHPSGYVVATIHTTCCGDISSTVPPISPPDWAITSGFVRVNALVDVVKSSFKICGSGFSVNVRWYVDQLGDKLRITITTSGGYAKIIDKTPSVSTPGQWINVPVYISAQELGLNVGDTATVTVRGEVIPSYPSTKWWLEDYEQFSFRATPLLTVNGSTGCDGILMATIGDTLQGTLTTLSDTDLDGNLDPISFATVVLSGPGRFDEFGNFYLEPWASTTVSTATTDLNGNFSLGTGWFDALGYHGARYDGIYKIEAQTTPRVSMYIYLKYQETITTDLGTLTVDLSTPQVIEGTLQLPGGLTPGNNDVYVELWKVDPVNGFERKYISYGPINEIPHAGFPPQTYQPVKLGPNGYFKIYAIIDELGSYALFTRVGNEKTDLGDYKYGRYYDQAENPVPYHPFSIGAPNYQAKLLVEPTTLYANKLCHFTILVTDGTGEPVDETTLHLANKFSYELPPGWTFQNPQVKPLSKGTYLISGTPVPPAAGSQTGSLIVKVSGAALISLPIQSVSLFNPYAYIDITTVHLDRKMFPPVVGEEYILVFGFYEPPTPGLTVFDPDEDWTLSSDETVFMEEISRGDREIKVKIIPTMYTPLPLTLTLPMRGVDNRTDEERGRVTTEKATFSVFPIADSIDGFKIGVTTDPAEVSQGGSGSISISVTDTSDVPQNNAWIEIWGYNKDGTPVSDMFSVGGTGTPNIVIDASHLNPLNQNIINGVYTQMNVGFNHSADPEHDRTPIEIGRYVLVKVYSGNPTLPTSKIMGYIPYAFPIKPQMNLGISLLSIDGSPSRNKITAGFSQTLLISAPGIPEGSSIIALDSKGSTFTDNHDTTYTLTLGEPYLEEGDARIFAVGPNRDVMGELDIPIVKPVAEIIPSDNILSAEINETVTVTLKDPITNAPLYVAKIGVDGKLDSFGKPFGFRSAIMTKQETPNVSSATFTVNARDNLNPTLPDSPKVILYYTTTSTLPGTYVVINEFDLVSVKVDVEIFTSSGKPLDKAIVGKANRIKITVTDAHGQPVTGAEVGITFAYNYDATIYDLKGYTDDNGVVIFTNFVPQYLGGYDVVVKKEDREYVFNDVFYTKEQTEDTEPPEITITEPEDGTTLTQNSITVLGTVSDESEVTAVYVNGMRVELLPDNSFMVNITLNEGENLIRVVAVDEFGNIGTKEIHVTYKVPTLTLVVDEVPKLVNTPEIEITGKTDPGATVYVNDEEADVDEDGNFSITVTLLEGLNTLIIRAEKGALSKTKKVSVTLDSIPPILKVNVPEKVQDRVFEVSGTTEPTATLTINDEPVIVQADGTFTYTVSIPEGEKEITLEFKAVDRAGNEAKIVKTVIYQEEIIIELVIDSPVIKVTKNGVTTSVIYEIAPFVMPPGRTMVPLRFIAETFGATVDWDPETEGIHIELPRSDGSTIVIDMQLGNKIAYVNGEPYALEVAPFTVEPQGRTVVPIRFIAEAFGAQVDWDPLLQKVTITFYP